MKTSIESTYRNKGRALGWGSGPDADWKVMFLTFVILLLLTLGLCINLYIGVRNTGEMGENNLVAPISEAKLKRVSGYYQKQKLDFESARSIPETIKDPSL